MEDTATNLAGRMRAVDRLSRPGIFHICPVYHHRHALLTWELLKTAILELKQVMKRPVPAQLKDDATSAGALHNLYCWGKWERQVALYKNFQVWLVGNRITDLALEGRREAQPEQDLIGKLSTCDPMCRGTLLQQI